jgi:hypothetical protein
MKKSKVLLNFVKLPTAKKIQFYKNVIDCLTNHPAFKSPDVAIAELVSKVNTLEKDYEASMGGDHSNVTVMHQSREAADEVFRQEAHYVERIAKGDVSLILYSGFEATAPPKASYNKPLFMVKAGEEPGVMLLSCKAIKGAKAYLWQYSVGILPDKDKDWLFAGASTQVQYKMVDLESGTKCWFRRAPITVDGFGPWSNPVMKVVP